MIQINIKQKMFHNRETNSAVFFCNTVSVFQTPLPFYATQIINPFLNQGSQLIMIKGSNFSHS